MSITNTLIPIAQIAPHPRNYRSHPDTQLAQLGASYTRFGQFRSVVVVARSDGSYTQVAGHGIVEAMKRNGATEVRVDVLSADTSPEDIEAILIADNTLGGGASDDEELLATMLKEQQDAGFDLAAMGSDDETLRQMLQELGDSYLGDEQEEEEYDYELLPEGPTRTSVGELWQLGKHRLLVGDSTSVNNVSKLLQGVSDILLVTDPPYGINLNSEWQNDVHKKQGKALNHNPGSIANDAGEITSDLFLPWPRRVVFGFPYLSDSLATGWFVWDKEPGFTGRSLTSPVEMAYSTTWKGFRVERLLWSGYMRESGSEEKVGHPTQKPIRLISSILERHGDTSVLDLFLGSGTTLLACERLDKQCYGIELDPKYADVILKRWEAETQQTAVLLEPAQETVNV